MCCCKALRPRTTVKQKLINRAVSASAGIYTLFVTTIQPESMNLLPAAITDFIWKDFEPICLHDSTLSFASHALFAAQNGLKEEASRYLYKALLLDVRDIMGNTGKEGLHLACMGEAWQAAKTLS